MSFDADINACAAIVEKGDPERFAAAMASPVAARAVLFPLYAFNVEVTRAPWVTQEAMIAEMRLQWWRDALEEIGKGGPVRRHEVVTPLSQILDPESAAVLDRLVAARRWDIYKDAFEDEAHLDSYLRDTAAGLMWVAARTLDSQAGAQDMIYDLGYATGLARFLQAVPALEDAGRVPLVDGRPAAVAGRARDALSHCSRKALRRAMPGAARAAITEAYATKDILHQVVRDPGAVATGALGVSPVRRSFRLWQWS